MTISLGLPLRWTAPLRDHRVALHRHHALAVGPMRDSARLQEEDEKGRGTEGEG